MTLTVDSYVQGSKRPLDKLESVRTTCMLGGGREGEGEDGGRRGKRETGARRGGTGREKKEGVGVGRRRRRKGSSLLRCLRAHGTKLRTVNDSVDFRWTGPLGAGGLGEAGPCVT